MKLKDKIDKRATLVKDMRAILDKADADGKPLNADQTTKYEAMETEVTQLTKEIQRENALNEVENSLRSQRDSEFRADPSKDPLNSNLSRTGRPKRKWDTNDYANAIEQYARRPKAALQDQHLNALQEGADGEGGYLVPVEYETRLIEILVNLDPIRRHATVISTASDRNIPIEASKGTFSYFGEEADTPQSDPSFGRVVLGAFKCGGIIKISEELLQDSFFDLPSYLLRLAGFRYNALESNSFAVGNGVNKPLGLFVTTEVAGTAVTGTTGAVSASAAITADNLVDTFHGLGRPYRGKAIWLTSDTMVKMIRKLKTGVSGDNTYLWQPGLSAGAPDTLLGRPVEVSDDATAPAPDAKSIIFGDLSHYYIADRLGTTLQRLNELYAANGQIGFRFTRRHDARLTNAAAITFFTHGAAA